MNPERAPRGVKADFEPTDHARDNEFPKVRERNPEHGYHRACGSVPHCQQQWLWGEQPSSQGGLSDAWATFSAWISQKNITASTAESF